MENYKNPDFVAETDGTFFRKMAIFENFTISNGKKTLFLTLWHAERTNRTSRENNKRAKLSLSYVHLPTVTVCS